MTTRALTGSIPNTFQRATVGAPPPSPIDVGLAHQQHSAYVNALKGLGLEITQLPADDRFPDCCFVEDCVLFHNGVALIANSANPARRGEEAAVRAELASVAQIESMTAPATLDGGDCMRIENRIYVGLSARTNKAGVERVRQVFEPLGLDVFSVPVVGALHLKSVCSYLGKGKLLLAKNTIAPEAFGDVAVLTVHVEEAYAANALAIGSSVLSPLGFPRTHDLIESAGFTLIPLDTSEIRKADGSLTCLSVLF